MKHNLELKGQGHEKVTKCTQLKVSMVAKIFEVKPVYRISIYEGLHRIIFDKIATYLHTPWLKILCLGKLKPTIGFEKICRFQNQ